MNTKTTVVLAVLLTLLGVGYVVWKPVESEPDIGFVATSQQGTRSIARPLFETRPGELMRVVCRRKGGDPWIFERDPDLQKAKGPVPSDWNILAPITGEVLGWQVEKFGQILGKLVYEITFDPGTVDLVKAGLDPALSEIEMTDEHGLVLSVKLGWLESEGRTFAMLPGDETVYAVNSDLTRILRPSVLEYRSSRLWTIFPSHVRRIEIVDRTEGNDPITYDIVKRGPRWMFESPIATRASTPQVLAFLNKFHRPSVTSWTHATSERYAGLGLDPPAITLRITTEREKPVAPVDDNTGEHDGDDNDTPEEPAPKEIVTKVHEIHFSNRSPIDRDETVYIRLPKDSIAVGLALKGMFDAVKVDLEKWRDMYLTHAKPKDVTRIELDIRGQSATIVRGENEWHFEPNESPVESGAVVDFLKSLVRTNAVVFLDETTKSDVEMGFDSPVANITLTLKDKVKPVRIIVGGFTDQNSKQLVYVRNHDDQIGKIRASDAARLTQNILTYHDRSITKFDKNTLTRITLATKNPLTNNLSVIKMERVAGTWKMTTPMTAELREGRLEAILDSIGVLRAEVVVGNDMVKSAYGLHEPDAKVMLQYERSQPTDDAEQTDTSDGSSTQTIELALSAHEGRYYVMRSDRSAVYEIERTFFNLLFEELRVDSVWRFDESKVRRLEVRSGDVTQTFNKIDGRWTYEAEPDFPINAGKFKNLLLQIRDLRTQRYVFHEKTDLTEYGLDSPAYEVRLVLDDGESLELIVSAKLCDAFTERGSFTSVRSHGALFLLTNETIQRFQIVLDELTE